jgi:hypothetical protein
MGNKAKKDPRGRKTVQDKVVPVTFYVKESVINRYGGIENARFIAKECLEKGG